MKIGTLVKNKMQPECGNGIIVGSTLYVGGVRCGNHIYRVTLNGSFKTVEWNAMDVEKFFEKPS
jgi:hypothetical protein